MQEIASLEHAFSLSALEAGEECRSTRTRIYRLLEERGFSAAPTLVSDVLTAALDGSCSGSANRSQFGGSHTARCMSGVSQSMTRALGSRAGRVELRLEVALRFLETWFASAPRSVMPPSTRPRLDLEAIGAEPADPARDDPWFIWRRSEEQALSEGGSPAFRRALAEIRTSSVRNVGEVDERIWFMKGDGGARPRDLRIDSVRRAGREGIPERSPVGVFSEVSPHGIPPDPSRVTPADLALFSANPGPMRGLLASKLADSSLMVRFGSMPTPARQRPRVLIVAGLFDSMAMHVQRNGRVAPDIEVMRECLLHAIVSCVQTFGRAEVDFELEVRRDGPIARGSRLFSDVRNLRGQLKLEYRRPDLLRDRLLQRAPWIFADTPSMQHRSQQPPPSIAKYDASYLLGAGVRGRMHGLDWTGSASAEPDGVDQCTVTASGSVARPPAKLDLTDAAGLGRGLSECFGDEPKRLERGEENPTGMEGAVIA